MAVSLRRMRAEDIAQVIDIEREAFAPLWVSPPFKRELSNRFACYLVASYAQDTQEAAHPEPEEPAASHSLWTRVVRNMQGLVRREADGYESSSIIAGYVSMWYQGEEAHITEIAVREDLRGNGIGELLLIGSVQAATEHGSQVLTLEVRISNFIAQRLYEKYGFKAVGVRKGYYSDNREDAAIMTTSPIQTEEYQRKFRELQEKYQSRWGEICIDC